MASLPGDAAADLAMTPPLIVPQCGGNDGESLRERPPSRLEGMSYIRRLQ